MWLLCTTRSDKLETPHTTKFRLAGRMEAEIKIMGGFGVIPRRMYAQPFHNKDETRAQNHSDVGTNDAGKKTWTDHGRVVFKTSNFTGNSGWFRANIQATASYSSVSPKTLGSRSTVDPKAYAFCVRGRLAGQICRANTRE